MLDVCPNKIAGHGNSWSPYERGLGERVQKQPVAKAPMRCLPVSLPFPQHSNFAPLLSPSGTSSSCPAKGREKYSPFNDAGWAEAPAATLLAPKRDNCCSSALTLLPSTCSPPAAPGSSRPGSLCPGGWHTWGEILYEMDSNASWARGPQNL